jgi:hypothetical protein
VLATHSRSWERKQRIEREEHREAARKHSHRHWLSQEVASFVSLGDDAKTYLERLAASNQPLQKSVRKLLALKDHYGPIALIDAIRRALSLNAHGATYVENILYQEATPRRTHPPVTLKRDELNRIRLDEPSLADYDALVVKGRATP